MSVSYADFLAAKAAVAPESGITVAPSVLSSSLHDWQREIVSWALHVGGIGSELWTARKLGRKAIGCELKPSYWQTAVSNLRDLDAELTEPGLFDGAA